MGRLFIESEDGQNESRINKNWDKWLYYSVGYKTAAELIENDLIQNAKDKDFLIYPLMYLHRHYLELILKEIIVMCNELKDIHDFIPNGKHSLMKLWNESQKYLNEWYEDYEQPEDSVKIKIEEFHNIDVKSFSFRYPIDIYGDENLKPLFTIDYKNFSQEFHEVKSFLENIVDGLYVARDHIGFIRNTSKNI